MMRWIRQSLVSGLAAVGLCAATPARGQFDVAITPPAPLNTNAGGDTGDDCRAQVTSDGEGNWVAVWHSREPNIAGGIGMDRDILVARSSDNGATWTAPAPLNNNADSDAGNDDRPQVATDGQGNWVAVWFSDEPDIAGGIGNDDDILVARSTNNGATWTAPAPLNTNAGGDTGFDSLPHVATDGQGNWVAVWGSCEPNIDGGIGMDSDILVARSSNNGATWTDPAPLNTNAGDDTGGDGDPQIATDGLGNWVAVWHSDEPDIAGGIGDTEFDTLVARSTDNGAIWTAPTPLNSNAGGDTGNDFRAQVTSDGQGNWVAVWDSEEPALAGGIGMDVDILVARSSDNGATWTDPAPLNTNADTDAGDDPGDDFNPRVATDGQGNWVAALETCEPNIAGGIGMDFDILVARSTDNGATWTDPAPLNTNAEGDPGHDFSPQVATDGQGNWVAVWESFESSIGGGIGPDGDILVARFALPDCNNNGIGDGQDIADGTSEDCNANGVPDECEADTDGDGVIDDCDNCASVANADQADADADGIGDVCDNCPNEPNAGQEDAEGDGIGDACPPACCGGGLPALMPLLLLGWGWIRRRAGFKHRASRGP